MENQEIVFKFSIGNGNVYLCTSRRQGLWPSHHNIQWVLWASSLGVKRPEGEVNISKV
jgi:hypothetical protein